MQEKIQPNLQLPERTAEEYCEHLRGVVEIALQEYFGKLTDGWLDQFAGKLSTSPAKVQDGVNFRSLDLACDLFSRELQQCLSLLGLQTEMHGSTYDHNIDTAEHIYLTPKNAPHDTIIDPAIGQFIMGHNHVFVGTREQLKSLVLNYTGYENPYRFRSPGSNDTELLFKLMWGDYSKPLSQFTGRELISPIHDADSSRLSPNFQILLRS